MPTPLAGIMRAVAVLLAASARAVTYETLSLGSCIANVNLIIPSNPTSLIVAFHGSGDDADGLERLLMTGILLDEEDFSDDERADIYARGEAEALLEARGVMLAVANGHESECYGDGRQEHAQSGRHAIWVMDAERAAHADTDTRSKICFLTVELPQALISYGARLQALLRVELPQASSPSRL